jgi:hypothetical protein
MSVADGKNAVAAGRSVRERLLGRKARRFGESDAPAAARSPARLALCSADKHF